MSYKIKQSPEDFIVDEMIDLKLEDDGRYSYFLLKKKNWNTEDAIFRTAEAMHIGRIKINSCGNKDKNAITTQYISIEDLDKSNRRDFSIKDIELKYIGQGNLRLNLGTHKGNRFRITVRDADTEPKKDVNKVKNYFGPQRFSNNNHLVGRAIIKKDFRKAIELISENHGEHEWIVRDHIEKNKNDFIGAMRRIPKKIMSLYINAYQSFIFNRIAEEIESEENIKIPLIGFGTDAKDEKVKAILDRIIGEEEITFRDFIIRQFPEISSEGEERFLYMDINNFSMKKEDNYYIVEFDLGRGSYATTLIEYLFI